MPEALFGKAKCFECSSELTKALEVINQAVVLYSGFVPALLEKMKIHLAMSDWDQMLDSCNRFVGCNFLIMQNNQCCTLLKKLNLTGRYPRMQTASKLSSTLFFTWSARTGTIKK